MKKMLTSTEINEAGNGGIKVGHGHHTSLKSVSIRPEPGSTQQSEELLDT